MPCCALLCLRPPRGRPFGPNTSPRPAPVRIPHPAASLPASRLPRNRGRRAGGWRVSSLPCPRGRRGPSDPLRGQGWGRVQTELPGPPARGTGRCHLRPVPAALLRVPGARTRALCRADVGPGPGGLCGSGFPNPRAHRGSFLLSPCAPAAPTPPPRVAPRRRRGPAPTCPSSRRGSGSAGESRLRAPAPGFVLASSSRGAGLGGTAGHGGRRGSVS